MYLTRTVNYTIQSINLLFLKFTPRFFIMMKQYKFSLFWFFNFFWVVPMIEEMNVYIMISKSFEPLFCLWTRSFWGQRNEFVRRRKRTIKGSWENYATASLVRHFLLKFELVVTIWTAFLLLGSKLNVLIFQFILQINWTNKILLRWKKLEL